jgi:hypothetical protein
VVSAREQCHAESEHSRISFLQFAPVLFPQIQWFTSANGFGMAGAISMAGIAGARVADRIPAISSDQEFHMFDGKNNRLLDSFSFRLALMAAIFAVWSGAGYILLLLA